jgi:hypothetical protein
VLDALDAVLHHDIGRLDIAVDQPLGVGDRQGGGDLQADPQDQQLLEGQAQRMEVSPGVPLAAKTLGDHVAERAEHDDGGLGALSAHGQAAPGSSPAKPGRWPRG